METPRTFFRGISGQRATVLLDPQKQQIGDRCYEVAFLADPDGLAIEFLRLLN